MFWIIASALTPTLPPIELNVTASCVPVALEFLNARAIVGEHFAWIGLGNFVPVARVSPGVAAEPRHYVFSFGFDLQKEETMATTVDTSRETVSLIGSDKVDGTAVYGADERKIGSVQRVMIDKISGKVAYAVVSFGGFLGMGEDYYPMPWPNLKYDTRLGGYRVSVTGGKISSRARPKIRNRNTDWDWSDPRPRSPASTVYYKTLRLSTGTNTFREGLRRDRRPGYSLFIWVNVMAAG